MPGLNDLLEGAKQKLVLVEGMKDKKALLSLGFEHVVSLKNRPLFSVVESIEEKEIVILTDFDEAGRSLFSRLSQMLQRKGVRVDNRLRIALMREGLSHVEGLATFMKNHQKKI